MPQIIARGRPSGNFAQRLPSATSGCAAVKAARRIRSAPRKVGARRRRAWHVSSWSTPGEFDKAPLPWDVHIDHVLGRPDPVVLGRARSLQVLAVLHVVLP